MAVLQPPPSFCPNSRPKTPSTAETLDPGQSQPSDLEISGWESATSPPTAPPPTPGPVGPHPPPPRAREARPSPSRARAPHGRRRRRQAPLWRAPPAAASLLPSSSRPPFPLPSSDLSLLLPQVAAASPRRAVARAPTRARPNRPAATTRGPASSRSAGSSPTAPPHLVPACLGLPRRRARPPPRPRSRRDRAAKQASAP